MCRYGVMSNEDNSGCNVVNRLTIFLKWWCDFWVMPPFFCCRIRERERIYMGKNACFVEFIFRTRFNVLYLSREFSKY